MHGAKVPRPAKSTVSLVIIACLLTTCVTGCATTGGPRQVSDDPFASGPPSSSWDRVRELAPAAAIIVTASGSPRRRYFAGVDDSALTVLNLTDPGLPVAAARVLRDMAAHHPEYFASTVTTGSFAEDNVRIGRDGVFVANRRIADLDQVVETIPRREIAEIWGPVVARGSVPGTVLGGWIGFAVGAVPGLGGASAAAAWTAVACSVAVAASLGFHVSSHRTSGVVYRAP